MFAVAIDDVKETSETVEVTLDTNSATHRTEKMFGPQTQPQPTIDTCTYVIQSTATSAFVPATSTTTAEQSRVMTPESVPVTSYPVSLSPRSSALQVTVTRRVSDPMFSAAYSPLDRPLLAPPLRRPHRAPPSARVATRFTSRPPPTSTISGPETVTSSQTLPLPVGSRRAVSRSAEVLNKIDVGCGGGSGVSATVTHSPFPARTRRRAATMTSYSDDDDDVDEYDDEYETREPATMKLVRLQSEINDRKRRLHQLLRRVNSLERNHPTDVDRWYPADRQLDVWDRPPLGFQPPRRYPASPQRVSDPPQRWTRVRAGAFVGPPPPSRQPRLYRSLSYDTDREPFLSRPVFDRLPPSMDQSYASPPCQRLPRNAAVVRPYFDPRRRYEPPPPGPTVYLPPQLPAAVPQKFGTSDWMTWSPRRSTGYSSQAPHSHMATPKCSPRHLDTCSVRSKSSATSVHDPTTKRVLITPDPRRMLAVFFTFTIC